VIAMLTVNGLVGIMAQPHMLATVGTGRDERTCRVGMLFGNFVKRVCTVGWMLVGLIVGGDRGAGRRPELADPENAFGFACRQLLFPGALGLLVASILAASMSACSAYMVDVGALFTEGLYRPHLAPNRTDRHYLWVGRLSGVGITMLGVLYAMFLIPERALHVPAHRNAGDLCRDQRARRHRVAASQPLGRAGERAERAGHELLALLSGR
jgi:Na+/proline symporter